MSNELSTRALELRKSFRAVRDAVADALIKTYPDDDMPYDEDASSEAIERLFLLAAMSCSSVQLQGIIDARYRDAASARCSNSTHVWPEDHVSDFDVSQARCVYGHSIDDQDDDCIGCAAMQQKWK